MVHQLSGRIIAVSCKILLDILMPGATKVSLDCPRFVFTLDACTMYLLSGKLQSMLNLYLIVLLLVKSWMFCLCNKPRSIRPTGSFPPNRW